MLSRFHLIPERHGQTDRRMDRWTNRIAMMIYYAKNAAKYKKEKRKHTQYNQKTRKKANTSKPITQHIKKNHTIERV